MIKRYLPRLLTLAAGVALAAGAALGVSSCAYQNEEELFGPVLPACDSVSVTYRGTIAPLMTQHCLRCHGPARAESGVVVTTHRDVQTLGRTGQLLGVIQHKAGYPAMPDNAPMLPACDINRIKSWVRAGMPDN